jgi:predicted RNA binding protein YcfA (HicA-like mRNA interferase family)
MPRFGPINRRDLIRYLKQLGFEGPYSGGRHQFLKKGDLTLWVPNPHRGDISLGFLARILRQAGIDRSDWEKL